MARTTNWTVREWRQFIESLEALGKGDAEAVFMIEDAHCYISMKTDIEADAAGEVTIIGWPVDNGV